MKKLLFFINSMQPAGGIERVVSTLSTKLSGEYQITILVKDDPYSFYPLSENTKIVSLGRAVDLNMDSRLARFFQVTQGVFNTIKRLKAHLQTNDYDYYYLTHPINVLEINLAGAEKNKIIISEHGSRSAYNKVYKMVKYFLYNRCLQYVIPTKTDTSLYKESGYPAMYIPHFRPDLPYSPVNSASKVVLNIGRFTADKQQLVLLEIWNKIVKEFHVDDWCLHIVGSGELEEALHTYVKGNGLEHYVKFLPPSLNIEKYYSAASVFALTSQYEGFGMVLLEAISFGLPCVSFDCPSGPRDIIEPGKNGYLVELNNMAKFAEALINLIKDSNERSQMADGAFLSSQKWVDDVILESWHKILKN